MGGNDNNDDNNGNGDNDDDNNGNNYNRWFNGERFAAQEVKIYSREYTKWIGLKN